MLCLGVIFLQVLLDNKLNNEEDVAKYLDLTVVGVIPEYERGKRNECKDKKSRTSHRELFVVSKDAPFQFVEAYKSLRTNLEFLSATSNCKTILITSSVPEEGKSNVA